MRNREVVGTTLVLLTLLILAPACRKPLPEITPTAPAIDVPRTTPSPATVTPPAPDFPTEPEITQEDLDLEAAEWNRQGVLRPIYFAYDSSELSADARSTMQANASWLAEHPKFALAIGGHCDERGTIEYNLALSERRAGAVRDYLVKLGFDRSRARIMAYGEERPAQLGHDESAWSRNRRAEFVLGR